MSLGNLIVPLGILTYSLLLVTIISGIKRLKLKYHKLLAFATIALATLHAALVVFVH